MPIVLAQSADKALLQKIVAGELDHAELAALKGNLGDQTYDVPGIADLEKYQTGAIYCERFHAIFGVAKLEKF